jgi:hypothetical protein
MEMYLGRTLETFGSKLEQDATLAKLFQENPVEALRSEGIPVVQYYALAPAPVEQPARDEAAVAANYPSQFTFSFWGAYFSITSAEAKALTVGKIYHLIQEAYNRLSLEQRDWVAPKLSGLELGMVAGIEVWKLMGQTCGGKRVESFSIWPKQNPVWTPPVCA